MSHVPQEDKNWPEIRSPVAALGGANWPGNWRVYPVVRVSHYPAFTLADD